MAIVYPTEAGNWSTRTWYDDATGATYSNGTPQEGDEVRLNGLTITMDQNITVDSIYNRAGTNAAAGGQLTCSNEANGLTLSADIRGNRGALVSVTMTSGNSLTVNGNVIGGIGAEAGTLFANGLVLSSTGHVTINGNCQAGTVTLGHAVVLSGAGTITVNGDCIGGGSNSTGLVASNSNSVATVNGSAIMASRTNYGVSGNSGLVIIKRAVASSGGSGYFGRVRFIDDNEPNLLQIRASNGDFYNLSKPKSVYPTEAGDWSTRTWNDDGTGDTYYFITPQTGDTVLTNNLTITMDQNITIGTLSTRAGVNSIAGGTLNCPNGANGLTLNSEIRGNVNNGQATAACTVSMESPNTLTINGNSFGSIDTGNNSFRYGILINSTGIVTINGNISANSTNNRVGLYVSGGAAVTINGNITGASNSNSGAIIDNSNASIIINGNATGGAGSPARGIQILAGTVTVNGNAVGGTNALAQGIAITGNSNLTLNGTAISGAASRAEGINSSSTNAIQIARSKSSSVCGGYSGNIRFIDPTDPNLITLFDTSGNEFTLNKSTLQPDLRGGFSN